MHGKIYIIVHTLVYVDQLYLSKIAKKKKWKEKEVKWKDGKERRRGNKKEKRQKKGQREGGKKDLKWEAWIEILDHFARCLWVNSGLWTSFSFQ